MELYGPHGLEASGDPYVAEVLKRTISEQPPATKAFDMHILNLQTSGQLVQTALPDLTIIHQVWMAAILWQMATCYLDAMVLSCDDSGEDFSKIGYKDADMLCDMASDWGRDASKSKALATTGSKVRISQLLEMPNISANKLAVEAVWAIYGLVINQLGRDLLLFENSAIPARFKSLYEEALKQVRTNLVMLHNLQKAYANAMIIQNKFEVIGKAKPLVEELFELGQKLWAPFLWGPKYSEAMRRPLEIGEMNLGFDPWILTDTEVAKIMRQQASAKTELAEFWVSVTNVEDVRKIVAELADARRRKAYRIRTGRAYNAVPWASQLLVRKAITIGGRSFNPGELITVFVRPNGDKNSVEIRKTGKLTNPLDLLGQPPTK